MTESIPSVHRPTGKCCAECELIRREELAGRPRSEDIVIAVGRKHPGVRIAVARGQVIAG